MLVVHESSSAGDDLCRRCGGRGPWTKAGPVRRLIGTRPGAARWLLARFRLAAQGLPGISDLNTQHRQLANGQFRGPAAGPGEWRLQPRSSRLRRDSVLLVAAALSDARVSLPTEIFCILRQDAIDFPQIS